MKEIPDNFISENCKIETLVIPAGVKIVGDGFASSKSIREVYVPYTVEKIGTLNDDEYAPDVYIYTNKLTDIESLCAYIKTLYVPEELYVYYAELLKKVGDASVRLRKMPADKLDFYDTPVPSLTKVTEDDIFLPPLPELNQDILRQLSLQRRKVQFHRSLMTLSKSTLPTTSSLPRSVRYF